jgi:hypothetical protein
MISVICSKLTESWTKPRYQKALAIQPDLTQVKVLATSTLARQDFRGHSGQPEPHQDIAG